MEPKSYDARDIIITWGEISLEGAGDGDIVTIAYNADNVTLTAGAQGFMVATVSANNSGRVTWSASQATPVNDRLSVIAALQRRKGIGLIKKTMQVRHTNGTTLARGLAWIVKVPDTAFGDEHQNRSWMFELPNMELFVGGSLR